MMEKTELPTIGADTLEKQVYMRDIAAQIVEKFENVRRTGHYACQP